MESLEDIKGFITYTQEEKKETANQNLESGQEDKNQGDDLE